MFLPDDNNTAVFPLENLNFPVEEMAHRDGAQRWRTEMAHRDGGQRWRTERILR